MLAKINIITILAALLVAVPPVARAAPPAVSAPAPLPLRVAPTNDPAVAQAAVTALVNLPGQHDFFLLPPAVADWARGKTITGVLQWGTNAIGRVQLLAFMKDRDGNWFQNLGPEVTTREALRWSFDFSPEATGWRPVGHHMVWNMRARLNPQFVGLRIFSARAAYTGECALAECSLSPITAPATPPFIRHLRANSLSLPCNALFELRFDLPDRYSDPFDPAKIDVTAVIETPDGMTNTVHAFHMQDYYRIADDVGESLVPQGRPEWRLRYAPRVPGIHRYTLTATDAHGTTITAPATFEARAARAPGFVRCSVKDPRFFELDDGRSFFPIGHNIRSPFDTRMDEQFPWRFRHPPGTSAYRDYFRNMRAAGENFAEVWMCQWSLGLEWSPVSPGYHGAGDYHLGNAWELDEVLRWARENQIRVNLVLNNHGRVGLGYDAEWQDHPFNEARGGFIAPDDPMHFFDNARAAELQRRLYRYIVARWGWDSTIFAWELWSELDLVGKHGSKPVPQQDPRVIEWHRQMGDYLRSIDPNRHLVTTHLSGDYRITSPELAKLPQLDFCGIDAYHFNASPLHIVNLVRETAAHYREYGKPVMITEFGGSSMGAGLSHLTSELHAALWTSVATPLGGTPLFWWWQVIEEQNLYPMFTAVSRFMADVDRRDPLLLPVPMELGFAGGAPLPAEEGAVIAMAGPDLALGWVFLPPFFATNGNAVTGKPVENLAITWNGCSNTIYRTAFHDTRSGLIIKQQDERGDNGRLTVRLPPVTSDIAFKIRPAALDAALPKNQP